MLLRPSPSKIPGTTIRIVRLPRDHRCPHCKLPFRKVNIVKDKVSGDTKSRCPHCQRPVKVNID